MILLEAARAARHRPDRGREEEYLAKLAVDAVRRTAAEGQDAGPPEGAFDRLLVEKYTFLVVQATSGSKTAEILAYYERHKKDFLHQGRVQVSQILVDDRGEGDLRAAAARADRRAGVPQDRRRGVRWVPKPPEAGVMGVFEQGDLPADMEKVIFSLDEGRTSQVVESSYGFHIFRLDRKFPPALQTESEGRPGDPEAHPGPEDEGRPGLPSGRAQGDPGLAGPAREPILQLSEVGRMKKIIACLAMAGLLGPAVVPAVRPGGRRGDRGRRQRRHHHPDRVPEPVRDGCGPAPGPADAPGGVRTSSTSGLKKQFLDLMITELLLLQKAKELGLNVQEQLKGMLEKIKAGEQLRLRRRTCAGPSSSQGMSYEAWLKEYEEGMMRQGVLYTEVERSIVLEDSEVVQYYKKNPAEFTDAHRVQAQRRLPRGRRAARPRSCETLKAAIDAKLKGGTPFGDVAAELSDPPMKDAKGDLGTFKAGELEKDPRSARREAQGRRDGPLDQHQERLVPAPARGEEGQPPAALRRAPGPRSRRRSTTRSAPSRARPTSRRSGSGATSRS
ncbi:MAG: peptidyl-prolyl cis-trans isomerase [Ignavibacteriales bacterium]|nr:peptidyl-prolyl cis-trans isomerase [Ignavibacteriales bacterium]